MFYTAEAFLNISDNQSPVQSCRVQDSYEDFNKAYNSFIELFHNGETESWCVDQPGYCKNSVVMRIIDIFNEYQRIHLIINSDDYEHAENIMVTWLDLYINYVLKGRWLNEYKQSNHSEMV